MPQSLSIKGVVTKLLPEVKINDEFSKRILVLTTPDEGFGPKLVAIDFINKRMEQLDFCQKDQMVEVFFNVTSREYQGKYYTNLAGWRIKKASEEPDNVEPDRAQFQEGGPQTYLSDDDIPF